MPMERFADALAAELEAVAARHNLDVRTLYFGGGTPSLLPTGVWRQLADEIRSLCGQNVEEWTLEANPRTFFAEKAQAWRESGVTRVSLGVQSFDPRVLDTLGRDHSADDAEEAAKILTRAKFPVVSLDFMFAVPGQTLESWRETLQRAIDLDPGHVSTYNLTYEEDTAFLSRFESGEWSQNPDRDAEFFALAHDLLETAGFEHYEVSNYAKPGNRSLHNQAYWAGADYLGIGPSAVSTVDGKRWKNVADTAAYVRAIEETGRACGEVETLTDADLALERLALGLRTREGLPAANFEPESVDGLVSEGLAKTGGGQIWLTLEGMMVADEIAAFLAS